MSAIKPKRKSFREPVIGHRPFVAIVGVVIALAIAGFAGLSVPGMATMVAAFAVGCFWGASGCSEDVAGKRSEDAGRLAEILQETGRMAKIGGWELSPGTGRPIWSEEVYRIHELGPDEQPSLEEAINYYAPEARPLIRSAVERAMADGTPWDLEVRFITAKGRHRWVRTMGETVLKDGRCVRLKGTFQDITERKVAELARQESESRFRALAENTKAVPWAVDLATMNFTFVGRQAEAILGYPCEAWIADGFWETHLHEADHDWVSQYCRDHVSEGSDFQLDYRMRAADGQSVWVHDVVHVTLDGVGNPLTLSGFLFDITERKQAELTRRNQQVELNQILAALPEALVYSDPDRLIARVNPAFTRVFGYSPQLAIGRKTEILYARPEDFADQGRRRFNRDAENQNAPYEIEMRRQDGTCFPSETVGTPVRDSDGQVVGYLGLVRDLTGRRAVETKSEILMNRLKLATKVAGIGIWDWDIITDELVWDEEMYRVYGKRRVPGRSDYELWHESLHPDDAQMAADAVKAALSSGSGEFTSRFRINTDAGDIRVIRATGQVFKDADGRSVRLLGINQDITGQEAINEAIRIRDRAFATIGSGIVITDSLAPDQPAIFCNDSFLEMTGFSRAEVIGKNLRFLRGDDHDQEGVRKLRAALAERRGCRVDIRNCRKDGSRYWTELTVNPVTDDDGQMTHFVGSQVDVTHLRLAGEALRESENRFRSVFEDAPEGVFLIAAEGRHAGRIMGANTAAERIYGYAKEELIGREIKDLHTPESGVESRRRIERLLTGERLVFEVEAIGKEGGRLPVEVSATRIMLDGQAHVLAFNRDITERRQAEAEIRFVQENLEQAQRIGKIGSWDWDIPSNRSYWSDELYHIYGRDPADGVPGDEDWLASIHADDRTILKTARQESLRSGHYDVEYRLIRRDNGETRWIHAVGEVDRDPAGRPLRHRGLAHDVTERRLSLEAVRKSEVNYRTLVEASPYCIHQIGLDGKFLSINRAGLAMIGQQREERVVGLNYLDAIGEPDRERIGELMAGAFDGRFSEFEFTAVEGKEFRSNFVPIRTPAGEVVRLLGITEDITARRLTERERADFADRLRESERRLSGIIAGAIDAIINIDEDGQIESVNPAAEKMFGYPAAEMVDRNVRMLMDNPDRDRHDGYLSNFRTTAEPKIIGIGREVEGLRKDGSKVQIDLAISETEIGGRRMFIGILRDITERKRLERERQEIESQLGQQQKLESIGTLAAGVAHEINNPINGIMNYAQLISDRLPADDPAGGYATEIIGESERVAGIVQNLLAFSRQEQRTHSKADVADIIRRTASLIKTVMRHDQIKLEIALDAQLPPIECRSQEIQQVIMNLLTNARDALNECYEKSHEDKVIRITAGPIVKDGERWVRITVEDHGTGIAADVQSRIFDPFFTTKDRSHGTGLGLSISHGIVLDHGGTLSCESTAGDRTRFHLELPAIGIGKSGEPKELTDDATRPAATVQAQRQKGAEGLGNRETLDTN